MSIGRLEISELKWSASSVCFTNLLRPLSHLLMLKDLFPQEPRFYSIWKHMVRNSRTSVNASVKFWKTLWEKKNFRYIAYSSDTKNCGLPTQICEIDFLKKCVGGKQFDLNWYSVLNVALNDMYWYRIYISLVFVAMIVSVNAYAIIIILQNFERIGINPIPTHTFRREIHRWIRILNQKFYSAHAFYQQSILRICAGKSN